MGHLPQDELMFGGQLRPLDDLQPAARIFDKSGAAFNPIPVIAIKNTVNQLCFGVVDMAADDAVQAARLRFPRQSMLKTGDVGDGILYLPLQIGRERPIGQAQATADDG